MQPTFAILTVCTGNICRSPLAAQLLDLLLREVPGVVVGSAGTHAMVGHPMSEPSQEIARAHGVERPHDHRARQLSQVMLDSSDLILAMARDHRRAVVELSPRVARRVFTVREFARLAEVTTDADLVQGAGQSHTSTVEMLRAAVATVTSSRSLLPPSDLQDIDVIDPYGHDREAYDISARQLIPAVESTATLFRRAVAVGP